MNNKKLKLFNKYFSFSKILKNLLKLKSEEQIILKINILI